jgi:hypothetical protein
VTVPVLSDADLQRLILNEVGDVDPLTGDLLEPYLTTQDVTTRPGLLASQIGDYWQQFAWLGVSAPFQRDLYVKRHLIDVALGRLQDLVQESEQPIAVQYGGRVATLFRMRDSVSADLMTYESGMAPPSGLLARTAQVGLITRQAPWSPPPPGYPDANHPAFSGSPYERFGWRW